MAKNASPVDIVSKSILEAVTNKSPNLRYLAGKDVETWLPAKNHEGCRIPKHDEKSYKLSLTTRCHYCYSCHPKIEQLEKEKKYNPVGYKFPKQLYIKYKKSGQPRP